MSRRVAKVNWARKPRRRLTAEQRDRAVYFLKKNWSPTKVANHLKVNVYQINGLLGGISTSGNKPLIKSMKAARKVQKKTMRRKVRVRS